jgi:hypothetical protein
VARSSAVACGTQTSALVYGGLNNVSTVVGDTSLWNGTTWSAGTAMTTPKAESAAAGTSTDAYSAAGRDASGFTNSGSQKYNGTSWAASTSLPAARARGCGMGGSTSDVLVVGGFNTGNAAATTNSYYFNGTSWSTTYGLQTTRYYLGGSGGTANSTSGIVAGGTLNQNNVSFSSSTEIMASQPSITGGIWGGYGYPSIGRIQASGFGSSTSAVLVSGSISPSAATSTTAEKSDGIVWASTGTIGSEVQFGAGTGTASAGGVMMGSTGGTSIATFKSFNGTTWSVGGSNSVALSRLGGFGQSTTACGTAGGYTSGGSVVNSIYLYNGTTWSTSGAVLPQSLYYLMGSGTQTDAVLNGGLTSGAVQQSTAYIFNGTSISTTGSMTASRDRHVSFGSSSSLVIASAGQTASLQASSKFTGSSWTTVGTQIAQRWTQPTSSSNSGSTGVVAGGYVGSSTTIYQWGSEQYYN